ncbi:hypothetical protein DFS34DRAFT_44898 [Phlyctochytrium arcticum]|nr:hypothetical protein DFS34DRAFT_44898 [Phlyctochytrium arcticum]
MGASSRRTRLSAAASNQETENINPQMDSAPETNMASPTPLEDEDEGALRSKEDMIREFVTCKICDGYIIDATTIDPCLHSFCKPCIYKRWRFFKSCPQCQELLGPNPKEQLKSDHTVQNLIYKLVPNLQKLEKERLRKYEGSSSCRRSTQHIISRHTIHQANGIFTSQKKNILQPHQQDDGLRKLVELHHQLPSPSHRPLNLSRQPPKLQRRSPELSHRLQRVNHRPLEPQAPKLNRQLGRNR